MDKLNSYDIVVRIDELLAVRGETRKILADVINRNSQVFVDWKNKGIFPGINELYKISKHLGVNLDYLIFGKSEAMPDDIAFSISKLQTLTEEQRKPIIALISGQVDYWKDFYSKEN